MTDMQKHLLKWEKSGLSVKDYCAKEGISISMFYYHRKRARGVGRVKGSGPATPKKVEFRPVPTQQIRITLPSGAILEVTDGEMLKHVLRVMNDIAAEKKGGV